MRGQTLLQLLYIIMLLCLFGSIATDNYKNRR